MHWQFLTVFVLENTSKRKLQKAFKLNWTESIGKLEDTSTKARFSTILELLDDGEWHSVKEIRRKTKLSLGDIKKVIEFLAEYNFVVVDEQGEKVRLSEVFLKTLSHKSL